jgi:hypothetical protein
MAYPLIFITQAPRELESAESSGVNGLIFATALTSPSSEILLLAESLRKAQGGKDWKNNA